jgi:hypothetical protein
MINLEKIPFGGWLNCYRYSNNKIELIVTTDVGPRIIHYGWKGGENQFVIFPETSGKIGGDQWQLYGGHRLWNAPEHFPNSYYPDNGPIEIEEEKGFIRLVQPMESTTLIQKEMEIFLTEDSDQVKIIHRLRNCGKVEKELSPWSITALAPGGIGIIPFALKKENPVPKPSLVFSAWDYTDMADNRIQWTSACLLVRQDTGITRWLKVGLNSAMGVMAYLRGSDLFFKKFATFPGRKYTDNGSLEECWTNDRYLELEALAPMQMVEPEQAVEHTETWSLLKLTTSPKNNQEIVEQVLSLLGV